MEILNAKVENYNMSASIYRLYGQPEVLSMGFVQSETLHSDRVLDFWVLGMLTRGATSLQIGHDRVLVRANNYYLLPPYTRHYGIKSETSFDVIYFHFLTQDRNYESQALNLPVFGRIPPDISYLNLYRFLKRAIDFGVLSPAQINIQVAAILAQLSVMQEYTGSEQDRTKRLSYQVMDYIREHIEQDINSELIAEVLGYSYGHLDRVFRQHFGMSIHQKLQHLRIDIAAELLVMGKPIKEVGAQVGFHDYHYFLKVFKKIRGVSPGELQRRPIAQ